MQAFERHRSQLAGLAGRTLQNAEDARDVIQELFLVCLRHSESKNPSAIENHQAWLIRVTCNLCLDHLRRKSRINRILRDNFDLFLSRSSSNAHHQSSEELAIAGDDMQRFMAALTRLRPKDRLCLELFHSGFDYQQIATALSIRPSSVGTKLYRARHKLYRLQNEKGVKR